MEAAMRPCFPHDVYLTSPADPRLITVRALRRALFDAEQRGDLEPGDRPRSVALVVTSAHDELTVQGTRVVDGRVNELEPPREPPVRIEPVTSASCIVVTCCVVLGAAEVDGPHRARTVKSFGRGRPPSLGEPFVEFGGEHGGGALVRVTWPRVEPAP
jgi:hypothetical protein